MESSVGCLGELPPAPQKMDQDLSLQVSFTVCRHLCSWHQKIHRLLCSLSDITPYSSLFYFQNHLFATLVSPFLWSSSSLRTLLEGGSGSSSSLTVVDLSCTWKPLHSAGSFLLVLEVTSFHLFSSPEVVLTLGLGVDTVHPFISSYLILAWQQQAPLSFSEVSQPFLTDPGSCPQKIQKLSKQNSHILPCLRPPLLAELIRVPIAGTTGALQSS